LGIDGGCFEILKGKKFVFFIPELNANAIKDKILKIYNLWIKSPERFKE